MPQNINQPSNRINLTNVSVVRYRKRRSRFELACYKNKLLEYRSGTETSLDNILQVPTIFLNVSKGATAPNAELDRAFGKGYDKEAVIREILARGELQIGAGERREERERLEREVLDLVVGRLVDPETKRVYTVGIIRKALDLLSQKGGQMGRGRNGDVVARGGGGVMEGMTRIDLNDGGGTGASSLNDDVDHEGEEEDEEEEDGDDDDDDEDDSKPGQEGQKLKGKAKKSDMPIWTGVVTTKSAKIQALEAMKALIAWQPIPVMRARMRLRVTCSNSIAKQVATNTTTATPTTTTTTTTTTTKTTPKSKATARSENRDAGPQQAKATVKDRILSFIEQVETHDVMGEEWEVVGFVEPGAFKVLGEFVGGQTRGKGRLEVLDMAVTHED